MWPGRTELFPVSTDCRVHPTGARLGREKSPKISPLYKALQEQLEGEDTATLDGLMAGATESNEPDLFDQAVQEAAKDIARQGLDPAEVMLPTLENKIKKRGEPDHGPPQLEIETLGTTEMKGFCSERAPARRRTRARVRRLAVESARKKHGAQHGRRHGKNAVETLGEKCDF